MTDVFDFAAAKTARQHHWEGPCVCLGCRHEWQGVGPIGGLASLECPSCGLVKGVIKSLFGAAEGDLEFRCNCGCEALTAYQRKGRLFVKCMACGEDQTLAVYGVS